MYIELEVSNKRSNVKRLIIRERAIIGRQNHCDIRVVSNELSREHCRIEVDHDEAHLIDLGSTNGTYLNQNKLEPHQPYQLNEGDIIRLGPAAFSIRIHDLNESAAMDETLSSVSEDTINGDVELTSTVPPISHDEETISVGELESSDDDSPIQFTEDELDDLIDEEAEEDDSFMAGVSSDADVKTVSDEDDAYDRFLSDL
ncbi:FHA domain-containing protein [Rubinisphaera italica]|uniref:FHA domain-containing protein FhaA n=1 Tax=Rubinisphaera italica TaxID=2527969 RepID=A0A5C5XB95_9PLAN|nr:FHA domain-containing protein [Rubinisphaera italica]TWT60270.1 FHA domain-containing protein FhaA [Rubinisphaera italica]